ncbi:MAG TPA: MTAP family purine nucleoside phosphorylase [Tepidisphaeraceae bacterium]|nr:MTAP family purine nucleoside phosphorylase [Tepidisphaeraceae bacterium]
MSEIKIGLIGGSGLGQALGSQTQGVRHEVDTPFGRPSDAIIETDWGGLQVFVLSRHGPGHLLGPTQVPFRANIFAMKKLGVTHIIASGAVGSLREEFRPRDLVVPDQIIDKTTRRAGSFFEKGAVHVEFAEPFCPVLRRILLEEGAGLGGAANREGAVTAEPAAHRVHDRGCYVVMEGPAFSTRAESLMHRLWGGDLIGMTAMPEAKLAREAEIPYALVALVTDYDCWKLPPAGEHPPGASHNAADLLAEIIANLRAASDNGIALIRRAVERIAASPEIVANCPASQALKLAIWSDKTKMPREDVELLAPLWMKYFETAS